MTRGKSTRRGRRAAALAGLSAAALLLSAGAASADSGGTAHISTTLPGHVVNTVCENAANLPALSVLPDVPPAPAPVAECVQVNGWQ